MNTKEGLIYLGKELIYGGHWLSLGGVSIAWVAALFLGIKTSPGFFLIVYLGLQAIYLFNRYRELPGDFLTNPDRSRHLQTIYRRIPWLVFLWLFIFFAVLISFQKTSAFLFGLVTIPLGLLYSVFFKKFSGRIPGMKGLFVAACWSTVVVFLVLYYDRPLSEAVILLVLFVFLRWLVNTTVFDVKDIKDDSRKKIATWPVLIGPGRLIFWLKLITLASVIPILIGVYYEVLPPPAIWLIGTVPYTFYYLDRIGQKKNESFTYNVIIDGEFVLWAVFANVGYYFYGNT